MRKLWPKLRNASGFGLACNAKGRQWIGVTSNRVVTKAQNEVPIEADR